MLEKVVIGTSTKQTKTVPVCGAQTSILRCPRVVDQMNWLSTKKLHSNSDLANVGADRDGASFKITVGTGSVHAKRTNGMHWDVDLAFHCFR